MGGSGTFQFVVDTGCNLVVVADRNFLNKAHSQKIAVSGVHGTTSSLRSMGNLCVHFTDNLKVKPAML